MQKVPKVKHLNEYTAPNFAIESVFLEFDIQNNHTLVRSELEIEKLANGNALVLDGYDLELINIQIDGRQLHPSEYHSTAKTLVIYDVPQQFILHIVTRIYPKDNTQLVGLYKTGEQYCTQCEPEGFRRLTYFLDRPDVLTVYTTKIIADKKQFPILLSNGNLVDKGELKGDRHWAMWEDPFLKPSYLFALVAGDFDVLEDTFITKSNKTVQLKIYVARGDLEKSRYAMGSIKRAMQWDETHYNREYDLELFMVVAVNDFNAGAMENKGLNIFNSQYILAEANIATDDDFLNIESVIAHEYFHNWTGNRVTCRDWFQLCLKEGLTIFREQCFTEDNFSKAVSRVRTVTNLRTRQFPEDAGPLAHAVQLHSYIEISNFYSTTVYNKGAEIVRMLRTLLGEELFYQGMQWYFDNYDGKAVTTDDFIYAFEVVSKTDLSQFKLWYTQIGTPIIQVSDQYNAEKEEYSLHIRQENLPCPSQLNKFDLEIPVTVALFDEHGNPIPLKMGDNEPCITQVLKINKAYQSYTFNEVKSQPIPSLLRAFSAPVKLNYDYSDKQLRVLFKYDTDSFNRWEAAQNQDYKVLKHLVTRFQNQEKLDIPKEYLDDFNNILVSAMESKGEDKYFMAEMLLLPSEILMGEKMDIVNTHAIFEGREFLIQNIAKTCESNLLKLYKQNHIHDPNQNALSITAMANRRLKNICLFYLLALKNSEHIELAKKQFYDALDNNMTDTLGALRCLVNVNSEVQQEVLAAFYEKWKNVPRVVDKWFEQQALSKLPDTLDRVIALLDHPAFNLQNPNQVYSLIGIFVKQNQNLFHDPKGLGYAFLKDMVLKLNHQNSIVASNLIKPLLDWRRFDRRKQLLMRNELTAILNHPNLSKALYEVVSASLA